MGILRGWLPAKAVTRSFAEKSGEKSMFFSVHTKINADGANFST
jgi:hypothetical protein